MRNLLTVVLSIAINISVFASGIEPSIRCTPVNGMVKVEFNPGNRNYEKIIISRTRKNYVFEEIAILREGQDPVVFLDKNPTEGIGFYKIDFINEKGLNTFSLSQGIYVPFRDGIFVDVFDFNIDKGELILNFLNLEKGRKYPLTISILNASGEVVFRKKYKIHCHNCIKTFSLDKNDSPVEVVVTNQEGERVFAKKLNN